MCTSRGSFANQRSVHCGSLASQPYYSAYAHALTKMGQSDTHMRKIRLARETFWGSPTYPRPVQSVDIWIAHVRYRPNAASASVAVSSKMHVMLARQASRE